MKLSSSNHHGVTSAGVTSAEVTSTGNLVINVGEEDEMKITGYKQDSIKNAVCWVFTVLSAGLLRLVFHWRPDWMLKFTAVVTTLDQAQNVLLEDQYGQKFVETVICVSDSNSVSVIHKTSQRSEIVLSLRWTEQVCDPPVEEDTDQPLLHMKKSSKYFVNKMIKYFWTSQRQQFEKLRGLEEGVLCSFFHETKGLTETQQAEWRKIYGSNNISVHVTPIVKLLFTQVLNPFYIFQLFSCILWFSDQYMYYASCILVVSLLSIATQVYQTRSMQRALKSTIAPVELVNVFRIETGAFETVHSDVLVPGDIIEVPRHGCVMQCDAVLVNGNCIVNESMLTGESVPVTKTPIACHSAARDELSPATSVPIDATFQMNEHSRHVLFCGTHVIQTRYYGKQPVKAVVIRTGFSTAKGELVRSILFPKPVDFKFSQDGIKFMGFLAVIAVMGMMYTMILMIRRGEHAWLIIRRTLDLVTIIVPPALPAAMTIGVVFAQKRLARRNIFCISPRSINLCGAVNAFCFDKTGTLTEDGLDMWGVVPAYNSKFENEKKDVNKLNCRDRIVACMAACHSLTIVEEKITGDPLDVKMFEATDWVLEEPGDDSTKYDVITPTIVHPKNPDIVEISAGYESSEILPYEIGILRQFTFSSKLQRMSVITRELSSRHFDLYAKGSPEMIVSLSKPETVPSDFHDVLMRYTEQGYRVIGLGHKELANMSYVKIQRAHRDLVEVGLTFLGLLVLENRLKIETTPVIRTLKEADIRALMITGDNMLTALSVARECEMIDRADRVVHVTVLPPTESQGACIEYTDNSINKVDGESIAIDMEPGNKVHFSITGNSWSLLRKFHPAVVQKLLVRGTVFARFSPEQKQQLIEALQNVGYYVGMCGDGANDCGALKTAHAGISLSEAEASVASPFTSKHANIECVPKLIMEGRAALVTSYGIFKFMAGYSMTQFLSVCLVYWIGANLTDFTFLYIDLPLLTTLGITFCYTEAYPILHRRPPKISLLALTPIISIILILFINVVAQVIVFIWVTQQPWFEEYTPVDEFDNRCFEVTAVFSISAFQYIGMAIIFSKGFPYRKNMFTNYLFLINLILCTLVTAIIVVHPPQFVADLLDLRLSPSISFRAMFLGLATINFLLSLLVEMLVIDQLIDNRLMQWWRKTVASKQVAYVCIEDELNRDANWPPISQGGKSLVDMMRLETNANSDDERLLPNSKASDSDREQATDSTESTSPEHISSCTPHPVIDCLSVKIMADNRANCDRSCIL